MIAISSITNPFVGLRPYNSDESLLFFGRQKQIIELLDRLHQHQFVAITGSSGCGKSSLIRAGLIPKLKAGYLVDDRDEWLITVMKPGETPIDNLTHAIVESLNAIAPVSDPSALSKKIRNQGADAILKILNPAWEKDINFFLLIDQFEELFPDKDLGKNEINDEAINFVNILLELSSQKALPVYIVITMRSDYIGDCARFYNLPEALNQSQYIVPRLNRIQLKSVIESPVKLLNGRIHSGLTERLLNDAQNVKVELPLLQHVLMRIWEREKKIHQNGELDLEDYENIGGIEKALSNHANEALKGMTTDEISLAKKIFQSLTRIDEKGRKTRRRVHLRELVALTGKTDEQLRSVIKRFNDDNRSFLVTDGLKDSNDLLIDISHESLIGQWDTLNKWVDEEAESAKIFLRLAESAELFSRNERNLLSGNELHLISQWYYTARPDEIWAQRYKADFGRSTKYLEDSENEETRQRLRKQLNRNLVLLALVFVILLISAFAIFISIQGIKKRKELVSNYWNSSQSAKEQNNYLDALHLIAKANLLNDNRDLAQNLLMDGEAFLPRTRLTDIFPQQSIITSTNFSPDGKWILVAGADSTARILDRVSGKPASPPFRHAGPVVSAVFSPDGKWILTASGDRTSCTWNAVSGEKMKLLQHPLPVTDAVFSPDGKMILTGDDSGYVRTWHAETGQQIDSLKQEDAITSIAFNPDGKRVSAASVNGNVLIWDISIVKKPDTLKHDVRVTKVIFSQDGKKILTTCEDKYARIWDADNLEQIFSLRHEDGVTDGAFSPDGKWILTACKDKKAYLWDAFTAMLTGAAMKDEGPVYSGTFSNDGKWIMTAGGGETIRIWSLAAIVPIKENIFIHPDMINAAAFSPDGTKVLTACDDNYARIRDLATGNLVDSFNHAAAVTSAVFSPDGTKILTACKDSTIHLWSLPGKKKIGFLKNRSSVTSVAFSPDGKRIAAGYEDGHARLWNADEIYTVKITALIPYKAYIRSVVISPDGKKILIAGDNKSAILFNIIDARQEAVFEHDNAVTSAVFSPDGKQVLTASWDNTVRLWNVVTGRQTGSSMKHKLGVGSAVFSPAEKKPVRILTSCFDLSVHLWGMDTKKEIGIGKKQEGIIYSAVFSPDAKSILTASGNVAHIWEMESDLDIPAKLFQLQTLALTGVRYDIETGETQCIPLGEWYKLKNQYDNEAGTHYKSCKYQPYNWWGRFNHEKAQTD